MTGAVDWRRVAQPVAKEATYEILALTQGEAFPDIDPVFKPYGGRLIVQLPRAATKTKGGVLLPVSSKETQEWTAQVGKLVAKGPLAFHFTTGDKAGEPWPEGAWAEIGDFVRIPKHSVERWSVPISDGKGDAVFVMLHSHELLAGVVGDPLKVRAILGDR